MKRTLTEYEKNVLRAAISHYDDYVDECKHRALDQEAKIRWKKDASTLRSLYYLLYNSNIVTVEGN